MNAIYFLTNEHNTTLYIGVTNDLQRRITEHKFKINDGFTKQYNTTKLIYYEPYDHIEDAIKREKQLKNWHRDWKNTLVEKANPEWKDLSDTL